MTLTLTQEKKTENKKKNMNSILVPTGSSLCHPEELPPLKKLSSAKTLWENGHYGGLDWAQEMTYACLYV